MKRTALLLPLIALLAAAEEPAAPARILRAYDLGLLAPYSTPPREIFPGLAEGDFHLLGRSVGAQMEGPPDNPRLHEEPPAGRADFVMELLHAFAPAEEFDWWKGGGGTRLLVSATEACHRTISRILTLLRAPVAEPIEIDVRYYSLEGRTLDDAARAALRAAEQGQLEPEQVATLAKFDVAGGCRGGTLEAFPGWWSCFRAVREVRYAPDYQVEIAQASAIGAPNSGVATEGVNAAVRPLAMQDGRLLLRIVASAGRIDGIRSFDLSAREHVDSLRLRNTDFGVIQQCDFQGGAFSSDAAVAPGRACSVVLASPTLEGTRFEVLVFTVRAVPQPAPAEDLLVAPIGALIARDVEREFCWSDSSGDLYLASVQNGEALGYIDPEPLIRLTGVREPQEGGFLSCDQSLYGGILLLRAPAAEGRAALDGLREAERNILRPAWLRIRFTTQQDGREPETAGVLALPLTVSRRAAAAAYRRMDTIGGYDVEVAQEARIADPIARSVTAGFIANALLLASSENSYRLQLELEAIGAETIRTLPSAAGGGPAMQSVPQRKRSGRLQLELVPGRPKSLDLGANPFDTRDAGRLLVIVSVEPR